MLRLSALGSLGSKGRLTGRLFQQAVRRIGTDRTSEVLVESVFVKSARLCLKIGFISLTACMSYYTFQLTEGAQVDQDARLLGVKAPIMHKAAISRLKGKVTDATKHPRMIELGVVEQCIAILCETKEAAVAKDLIYLLAKISDSDTGRTEMRVFVVEVRQALLRALRVFAAVPACVGGGGGSSASGGSGGSELAQVSIVAGDGPGDEPRIEFGGYTHTVRWQTKCFDAADGVKLSVASSGGTATSLVVLSDGSVFENPSLLDSEAMEYTAQLTASAGIELCPQLSDFSLASAGSRSWGKKAVLSKGEAAAPVPWWCR